MRDETRIKLMRLLIGGSVFLAVSSVVHAQGPEPIRDNSFLIEEAYNQDPGVVQHINTFARPTTGSTWAYTFTQEWPVRGMRHQLSYTVPLFDASSNAAIGDLAINYRYQLLGLGGGAVAVAPRATVLLPTGDAARGTGAGAASLQLMLPASVAAGSRIAVHANAGLTYTPGARDAAGETATATSYTAGASAIWLVAERFNVLVESVWNHNAAVVGPGVAVSSNHYTIAPGVRWAYNLAHDVQLVPGLAYAMGVGPQRDRSVFLYFSVEHPFTH